MAVRHDEYYTQDGDVIFLVGNKLFKIHKRVLMRSEASTFATMFSLPRSSQTEGQTDENPIVLEGDNLEDFEGLMRILYPPILDDIWEIPIHILFCAMRIANKYDMEDIKTAIIQVIAKMSARGIGQATERLAFMAEFPTNFSVRLAGDVFLQTCSISSVLSANDLKPLMAHPTIVAAMFKNRECIFRSQLESEMRRSSRRKPKYKSGYGGESEDEMLPAPEPRVEGWLLKELTSFGFSE